MKETKEWGETGEQATFHVRRPYARPVVVDDVNLEVTALACATFSDEECGAPGPKQS